MSRKKNNAPSVLRALLDERGWKASDLAVHSGVSSPSISRCVRGHRRPTPQMIVRFALALDIATADLARRFGVVMPPTHEAMSTMAVATHDANARASAAEAKAVLADVEARRARVMASNLGNLVQELRLRNAELESRIDVLKAEIAALKQVPS